MPHSFHHQFGNANRLISDENKLWSLLSCNFYSQFIQWINALYDRFYVSKKRQSKLVVDLIRWRFRFPSWPYISSIFPQVLRVVYLGLLLVVVLLYGAHGARILGLFPVPGRSHFAVSATLMKELASRGHQVTVLSPFPEKSPIPNYTDIDTRTTRDVLMQQTGTVLNTFHTWFLNEPGNKIPSNKTLRKRLCRHTFKICKKSTHSGIWASVDSK
jgi:hypothetical protein